MSPESIAKDKLRKRNWQIANRELCNARRREHRKKPAWKAKRAAYLAANRDRINRLHREWNARNPEAAASHARKQYLKNPNKAREWQIRNPDKVLMMAKRWQKESRKSKDNYALTKIIRDRICSAIKENRRASRSSELLGCSIQEYRIYLQSKFQEGMHWNNHGKVWQIDHIRPCASFDMRDSEQQKTCFHYTNTQPLYTHVNLKKKDSLVV